MTSLLSRPLHLISIDNNFTVTLYFYSDLKSCLPYQIRMGRGLHWDPFAHWWGHKNGHNLSQKKRHSNRFLKKISKGEFFAHWIILIYRPLMFYWIHGKNFLITIEFIKQQRLEQLKMHLKDSYVVWSHLFKFKLIFYVKQQLLLS